MAWIDPRFIGVEEARRREALAHEIAEAWRDWAEFKRKIEALQFETKWDGQPRDELGRFDFGKKPKPEPELVSQPAAMRPRGPRPSATPAQQARLAIANARSREAVARVQQLDPHWRAQSATSRDNAADYEVMIRAKEAEMREAEARYMALSRAGRDGPYTSPEPRSFLETLAPSSGEKIRTVNPAEFETIRTNLMVGARQIEPDSRYPGVWYKREDGAIFGLRLSARHGLTLDVIRSSHSDVRQGLKVHQR